MSSTADVAVVGAGFAGLAVATHLADAGRDVVVLEASSRPGGKLAAVTVGGCTLDAGADAWLDRDDAVRALVDTAALTDDVIGLGTHGVRLWSARGIHAMPPSSLMGLPRRAAAIAPALGRRAAVRAALEPFVPAGKHPDDVTVGEFVARRFGRAVAHELVDPLLGGVHAGHVDDLSLAATIPALAELAGTTSLTRELRRRQPNVPSFLTLRNGLHRLPGALATRLGSRVRTGTSVRALSQASDRWTLGTDAGDLEAEQVVLACPAGVVGLLVRPLDAEAATLAESVAYASVGAVALAYRPEDAWPVPDGTGLLVSRSAGRFIKAATWVTHKWSRPLGEEPFLVRASVGRSDDRRHLELSDAVGLAEPIDAALVRWDDALPQYQVGHLDRVHRIRDRLAQSAPGLHLVGAAWDGVGVGPLATGARRLSSEVAGR